MSTDNQNKPPTDTQSQPYQKGRGRKAYIRAYIREMNGYAYAPEELAKLVEDSRNLE